MRTKNPDRRIPELHKSKGKEQKSKNKIVAALLIAILASSFCLGMMGITEAPVNAEAEKKVTQQFREFEDLAELTEWLEKNRLPIRIIAGEDGRIDLVNPTSTSQYDCDDYAEALQRKALEQGYLMSQQLIINGKVYGVKVSEYTEPHMGNLTTIGNNIYYIESMPPHKVVRITSRD